MMSISKICKSLNVQKVGLYGAGSGLFRSSMAFFKGSKRGPTRLVRGFL